MYPLGGVIVGVMVPAATLTKIDAELERIRLESAPERIPLEAVVIPARKTDTAVEEVVLAWVPRGPRG